MIHTEGYWGEWVVRPGDRASLHLSGAGQAKVTLHPLNGNDVLSANNYLSWIGELSQQPIHTGSSATETVTTHRSNTWMLRCDLRVETAPDQRASVVSVRSADDVDILVTCRGDQLSIHCDGTEVETEFKLGEWFTLEIVRDAGSVCVTVTHKDGSESRSVLTSRSTLSTQLIITLGEGQTNGAHFRVCNVQHHDGLTERKLFVEPDVSHQSNNPVWSLADSSGAHTAIRFHPEDIGDVQWPTTATFDLPVDLTPGVYVASCTTKSGVTNIPLFVEPRVPRHRTAVIMSTFTYLAYAGYRQASEESTLVDYAKVTDQEVMLSDIDLRLAAGVKPGLSLYDRYTDGAAVYVASRKHPLIDFTPNHMHWLTHTTRNFCTDLELLEWLFERGIDVDVLTDDQLHREGPQALEHYDTVLTGSHPEYVSETILNTLATFARSGGHLLYLGGNGFDYIAEPAVTSPGDTIEVRRATDSWRGADAVDDQLSCGRKGGRWSSVNRTANQLMGVGYCTQGWGAAPGYRQLADARSTTFGEALLMGINPDETIGDFGNSLGGAAGDEIDSVDLDKGTPATTIRLASSEGLHTHHMMDTDDDKPIRADIAYTPNDNGGSVFAVGSMNWVTSLVVDRESNNVEKLTLNAIRLAQKHARSRDTN